MKKEIDDMGMIIEVEIKEGLPAPVWNVVRDPRILLAVVYELKKMLKSGDFSEVQWSEGNFFRVFVAPPEEIAIEFPMDTINRERLVYVLCGVLESMARILFEFEWGARFLADMQMKAAQSKGIVVPRVDGKLVL